MLDETVINRVLWSSHRESLRPEWAGKCDRLADKSDEELISMAKDLDAKVFLYIEADANTEQELECVLTVLESRGYSRRRIAYYEQTHYRAKERFSRSQDWFRIKTPEQVWARAFAEGWRDARRNMEEESRYARKERSSTVVSRARRKAAIKTKSKMIEGILLGLSNGDTETTVD